MLRSNISMLRLAKLYDQFCPIGYRFFHYLKNGSLTLGHGGPTISYETIFAKHDLAPYLS